MLIVQCIKNPLLLFMVVNMCNGFFHAPLYRVIPPNSIIDNAKYNIKSIKVSHKLVNVMQNQLEGNLNMGYYLSLGIGTPPQKFNFIIDTGSSNIAVAGIPDRFISTFFNPRLSSTFVNYGIKITLPYDSGSWKGNLGSDVFTFDGIFYKGNNRTSGPLKIKSNFTVIQSSNNFFLRNSNWEGIIGLAYSVLSQPNNYKNTLFDNLVKSTNMPDLFSIVLCGHKKDSLNRLTHGYFIAGGINQSLFEPPMVNIMIRRKWFYEIIISAISVSGKPIIISSCKEYNNDKTILDTGTTDTLLPALVFRSLVLSIINHMLPHPFPLTKTSAFWDRKAILCSSTTNASPPPFFFPEVHFDLVINDSASLRVALSPQQYISFIGNQEDLFGNKRNCYKFGFGESRSGTILGDSFLEGFYLVFNRASGTVGIAQSSCNNHYPGLARSRIISVHSDQGGLLSCGVNISRQKGLLGFLTSGLTIIIGLIIGMVLLIALIIMLVLQWRDNDNAESTEELHSSATVHGTTRYRSFD